jgi:CBS domain-containing protein
MEPKDPVNALLRHKQTTIWSIHPDASVYDAIELMSDKSIGALLVRDEGRLVGIITERDYARKVILQGRSSKDTAVREIMTTHIITVAPDETIDECMRLMTRHHIRHLPVMRGCEIVGILSIGDLVKWIISAQQETIGHLHSYITGQYPA